MDELTIQTATPDVLPVIGQLANEIWWPTYGNYLPEGQISLMLDKI